MSHWLTWPALDQFGYSTMRVLLGALWESSILLAAIGALTWFLRKRRASVRHALWVAGLVIAPLLPFMAAAALHSGAPQAPVRMLPVYEEPIPEILPLMPASGFTGPVAPAAEPVAAPAVEAPKPSHPSIFACRWAMALIAYGAGVAAFFAWFAVCHWRIRHWVKSARPLTEKRALTIFKTAREGARLRAGFTVLESARVPTPVSLGVWHPVVLLPNGLVQRLTDVELRSVAVHELAHLRRNDPLILSLLAIVRGVLFFHPLVWLATRRVATLAEQAADDAVLEVAVEPIAYAKLLARLAEELPRRALSMELATGIVFSRNAFLRRVEAILANRAKLKRLSRWTLAATLLALFISVVISCTLPLAEKGKAGATASVAPEKEVNDYSDLFTFYSSTDSRYYNIYAVPIEWERMPTKEEIQKLGPFWPNVPPEKNGVYYFVKADRALRTRYPEGLSVPPGSVWGIEPYAGDAAGFIRYIQENASVLATLKEGLNQSAFQFPCLIAKGQSPHPFTASQPLADIRNLARFLSDAGFAAELEGRPDVAAERYIECMQMGDKIQEDSTLIVQLVAMAVQPIGADGLDRLIANSSLDEVELKRIIAVSRDTESTPRSRVAAAMREGEFAKVSVAMFPETVADFGKDYDAYYAFMVKMYSKPLPELLLSAQAAVKEVKDKYRLPAELAELAQLHFENLPPSWARQNLTMRVLQVRAAIALYEKQHGAPPDRLDALVPEFLPEVPADPFDGKPLRYARTERGWKLWSVGYALTYDDGQASIVDERVRGGPNFVFTDKVRSSIESRSHRGATKSAPSPTEKPKATE